MIDKLETTVLDNFALAALHQSIANSDRCARENLRFIDDKPSIQSVRESKEHKMACWPTSQDVLQRAHSVKDEFGDQRLIPLTTCETMN